MLPIVMLCMAMLTAVGDSHRVSKTLISEIKVEAGTDVVVPCHLKYDPNHVAQYVWQKKDWYGPRHSKHSYLGFNPFGNRRSVIMSGPLNKMPIIVTTNYYLTTQQELKIKKVKPSDGGIYSCITVDRHHNFNQTLTKIKVIGAFDQPKINIVSVSHTPESSVYYVMCSSSNGYPWNSANLHWNIDGIVSAVETLRGPDGLYTWNHITVKQGQSVVPICVLTHSYLSSVMTTSLVLTNFNNVILMWLQISCMICLMVAILWSLVTKCILYLYRRQFVSDKYQYKRLEF
ncbi:protein ORF113 [Lake sturgeon herpesvirus]|nr:protein ORF113 [Lake sturgeon herpesvirus]